jgi:hypothetical protein
MNTEIADSITLTHPQSGATRGVKIVESGVGPGILDVGSITSVSTINGIQFPIVSVVYQATYYKTTAQNLTSGNTDITFDATGSWNNDGGYITHTNGTTDFTVVQTGLYQLEWNALVLLNDGFWTTATNKNVAIDITRPSLAEQSVISSSALMAVQGYAQIVNGSFYLVAGDIINLKIVNTFTLIGATPPQAQCVQNTIDLNTFFTWRFISL